MSHVLSAAELFDDCRLLFGPHIVGSMDFLRNLPPSELKAVYRKKAFETHPDRAKALGKIESVMNERFKAVILAYERLNYFVQNVGGAVLVSDQTTTAERNDPLRNDREATERCNRTAEENKKNGERKENRKEKRNRENTRNRFSDHFYRGGMPKRRLLIGQYLYYSGLISWRTLFDAVYWQRRQRPLIGQIALDWGILTTDEIRRILTDRNYNERFGEYAYRNGYINYFELLALRGKQLRLQRPIGEYFVQERILCAEEVNKMAKKLRFWNSDISQ